MRIRFLIISMMAPVFGFQAIAEAVYFWNASPRPIAMALYNANDSGSRTYDSGFNKAYVPPCSKIRQDTTAGGVLQGYAMPEARAFQTTYADVGSIKGSTLSMCVSADGKATGRVVEGSVNANLCSENSTTVTTYPAPEIVMASGSMPILQGRIDISNIKIGTETVPAYVYAESISHMCHY